MVARRRGKQATDLMALEEPRKPAKRGRKATRVAGAPPAASNDPRNDPQNDAHIDNVTRRRALVKLLATGALRAVLKRGEKAQAAAASQAATGEGPRGGMKSSS